MSEKKGPWSPERKSKKGIAAAIGLGVLGAIGATGVATHKEPKPSANRKIGDTPVDKQPPTPVVLTPLQSDSARPAEKMKVQESIRIPAIVPSQVEIPENKDGGFSNEDQKALEQLEKDKAEIKKKTALAMMIINKYLTGSLRFDVDAPYHIFQEDSESKAGNEFTVVYQTPGGVAANFIQCTVYEQSISIKYLPDATTEVVFRQGSEASIDLYERAAKRIQSIFTTDEY